VVNLRTLGPSIAKSISLAFLSGFGVNYDSLDHQSLGTPGELLTRNKRSNPFYPTEHFPADSTRYYEAGLDIASPPHRFENTSNHSLVSFEIEGRRYPIALIYDLYNPGGGYMARGQDMLDLVQMGHTTLLHAQIIKAMRNFGYISGRELYKSRDYISYPDFHFSRSGYKRLPLFPGVYPPDNDYVRSLLQCALPRIENKLRTQGDVRVLVVGCGSGVEALELVDSFGISVDCVDINPLAVANTEASAIYWGIQDKIHVWQSDGLESVMDKYDFILFNAPLATERKIGNPNPNLLDLEGKILRKVFAKLPQNLREGGRLLLMNGDDISAYLPSTLQSEAILHFKSGGVPLAIHEITPS
jgi:SAM-dependent methyltransferase